MKNEITKTPTVQDFVSALNRGEEALREAAKILCDMVDQDPKTYEKINRETGIHWNVLANLERVGRGAMNYRLLFDTSPASKYIAALPASQQADIYERGVKVVSVQNGKTIVEELNPANMSRSQARAVFSPDNHVRTVDEQIKAVKAPATVPKARIAQRYTITDDRLLVLDRTEFTMSQLHDILEEMKTRAIKSLATKKK